MNLADELRGAPSRAQTQRLARWVGHDETRFAGLMAVFFGEKYRLIQRVSAAVNACAEAHPILVAPYLERLLLNMQRPECPNPVRRNTFRLMQFVEIPEALHDEAFGACWHCLNRANEPVANRVFAMTVLHRLTARYPELRKELNGWMNERAPLESAGFRARVRKLTGK